MLNKTRPYLLLIGRLLIGLLFVFSGFSKLTRPIEYFQYTIGQFQIVPDFLLPTVSRILPWVEIIFGSYFLVGLWVYAAGVVLFILTFLFQVVLAQAVIRTLPIDDCGCFGGNFIHLKLLHSLMLDTVVLLVIIQITLASAHLFSLDRTFEKKKT